MKWNRILGASVVLAIFLWAAAGPAKDLALVVRGIPFAIDYILGMFPPDWSILPALRKPLLETLQMAVISVMISAVVAAPLSFLAAENTSPNHGIYLAARSVIAFLRAFPTLLWAILFVSLVGLGSLAGIFALVAHCVGALGKFCSEAIESLGPHTKDVQEAMRLDGANEAQVIVYGLVPEVIPFYVSHVLTYFEWSVRVGTILGFVGAGGLGLRLTSAIRMFRRQQTGMIILVILSATMIIDLCSRLVRARILES